LSLPLYSHQPASQPPSSLNLSAAHSLLQHRAVGHLRNTSARLHLHLLQHWLKQGGQTNLATAGHGRLSSRWPSNTQNGASPTSAPLSLPPPLRGSQAAWRHPIGQEHRSSHGIGQEQTVGSLGLAATEVLSRFSAVSQSSMRDLGRRAEDQQWGMGTGTGLSSTSSGTGFFATPVLGPV